MTSRVTLITVHGMGRTKKDYHVQLEERLRRELGTLSSRVRLTSVFYQGVLQKNQDRLFKKMRPHIDWKRTREFFMYHFSDASSLEARDATVAGRDGDRSAYDRTQAKIEDAVVGTDGDRFVVLAHSLGCQVFSNFVWDALHPNPRFGIFRGDDTGRQATAQHLARMSSLVTTGCNIPLFVAGHDKILPFTAPSGEFRWLNYYDEDDVLGWPLRPLSPEYRSLVKDKPVNIGGPISSWNPLSHLGYWTDREIVRAVAVELRRALALP